MSLERVQPPSIRNLVLAGLITVALITLFAFLPEVIKVLGAPFLYIPSKLGVVEWVSSVDVRVLDLNLSAPTTRLEITESGVFLVYTRNTDLLELAKGDGLARFTIEQEATGDMVSIAPIVRGLRPWDTPLARGRPIHRFEIETPGIYIINLRFGKPVTLSVVPDYTYGRERIIQLAFLLQGAVIAVSFAALYFPRYRAHRRVIKASQERKRARLASFLTKEKERRR